jgi:L-threonylcarbamoyladenylate synthase
MALIGAGPDEIARAAHQIVYGGVVAFPTETVYGLGAHAFDERAVARVYEIKARPAFDPLIVHVSGADMLERVAAGLGPMAFRLMARFWPGPLTLVLPKSAELPSIVTAGLPGVAVRMPSHPVARELIERAGVPIAAPSANPFGYVSPTRAEHVERMLGDRVDLILDGGPAELGLESTIVGLEAEPVLLRYGAIPLEAIEEITGTLRTPAQPAQRPLAPGGLAEHYAPRVPLRVVDFGSVPQNERARAAALTFGSQPAGYAVAIDLSPERNLRQAASRLFDALYELDASGVERIDASPVPEEGLGRAIMDRLRRASRRA